MKADGVDVNKGDRGWNYAFVIAAREGHASVVELLLKADGVDVNKANEDGATPLYTLPLRRSPSVVELLLKADGVDVNKAKRMELRLCYCRSRRSRVRGRVTVES